MTEQSVKAYMRACKMLPPGGGRVLCACSGGADSTALLHLLRRMEGVEVCCAHFNHRLRGAESGRDEEFVRDLCGSLGVEFYGGAADVAAYAAERKLGIEEAARELRYRFLQRIAREEGCCRVATAHTANDNAETVLLHLIRGAGGRGLSGIPPVRDNIIRPFLNTTRAEVEEYLRRFGLAHVEDGSNADLRFARNRLRRSVFPVLEELNARAVENICAAAALLGEDEAYFNGLAEAFLAEHGENGALPVPALLELPKNAAMRVFLHFRPGAGREHLEALYGLCASGAARAALDLPGGRAAREYDRLYFSFEPNVPPAPAFQIPRRELRLGGTTAFPELGRAVRCSFAEYPKEIYSSFNTFYFQSEKICGKIYAASRKAGDEIRLQGRNCTKSVRKLFSEAKIPLAERARTLVFSDGLGVVAVAGLGVAERCAGVPGRPALKIEIIEGKKMHDDILCVLYTEEELKKRVRELGAVITEDYRGKSPFFLGVLKGSFIFMADLLRNVDLPCAMDFMAVSSYGAGTKTTGAVRITKDLTRDIEGLDVIIVEDILDSGVTLSYLKDYLLRRDPASVSIVTLLDKPERRAAEIRADYLGFTVPDEFVVGYGLDFAEKYRNLPYIGILKPEIYE